MFRHRLTQLLALLLSLCLLCGCVHLNVQPAQTDNPTAATLPTATAASENPTEPLPEIDPDDYPDAVDFSTITYERPDVQTLLDALSSLREQVERNELDAEEIQDKLDEYDALYAHFDTMHAYAYIRYSLDLSDSYYDEEYNYLEQQSPLLQAEVERLTIACAESPYKDELTDYFGEEVLDFYQTHRVYSNEEFVALAQQENALEAQYMKLQDNQSIELDGKEQLFRDVQEQYADDFNTLYSKIYPAYYEKYNKSCAELYLQMIQLRKQMAKVAGFDSYQQFMFEFSYQRDYTPAQARSYVADLRDELLPLLYQADSISYDKMDMDSAAEIVLQALQKIDPQYAKDFRFMQYYHLWDVSSSSSKLSGSYETYLSEYSMPFVFLSPTGDEGDCTTLAHEFGHFIDSMENEGQDTCLDQCETFSQAMEFLMLQYSDLSDADVQRLIRAKLVDALQVFIYQGMYADFEDRVYQLDEPTVDSINETYADVMRDYGMYYEGLDWYNLYTWIDINHFFLSPCYIISYCTSADAALQVYALEKEKPGAGVSAYADLLNTTVDSHFLEMLESCGMESPFQSGRAAELADLFREQLFLP